MAIIGHSSKALCRAMNSRSQAWMDPVVWTGILRSGMKTDPARCSTIRRSMHLPAVTIRYMKMFTAASGTQYTARLQWNASRFMRTENRSMTAIMYAPSLRKPCGTKAHRPVMVSQNPVIKRRSSRQDGDDKRRAAGPEQWIRFGCLPIIKEKISLPLAV